MRLLRRPGRPRPGRLALVAAALVVAFLAASAVGARVAVAGSRAPFPVPPSQIGRSWTDVAFPSRVDRLALSGWLFHADRPTGRSVILVHGWKGDREDVDFVPLTRALLARGYDVLLFDLRGTGRSAGSHETFAAQEPRDLLGAYDFLRSRGYRPDRMTVLGNSMGAATVIEAAPQLRDVAALVSDSAFASLPDSLQGGLTRFTHLPGALAVPAMAFARLLGVETSLRPVDVVRSLPDRAFLFVHATGDPLLPVANARELAAASANPGTRLLEVPGHDHLDTWTHDPGRYLATLLSFIDAQVSLHGGGAPR